MPPLPETPVGEHGMRGIMARRAGDSATGVGAGAAQVETLQGHPVVGGADHRPRAEQLIETHLAMEDVPADQSEPALKIERRMNLPSDHRFGEARCVRIDGRNDLVGGQFSLVIPASFRSQMIAEMLAEQACDMLALRS